jgi:hypothetical protein
MIKEKIDEFSNNINIFENYPLLLSFKLLYLITGFKEYNKKFLKYYSIFQQKENVLSFLLECFYGYFIDINLLEYKEKLVKHPYAEYSGINFFFETKQFKNKLNIFNCFVWF